MGNTKVQSSSGIRREDDLDGTLSIIVPAYNEEACICKLHQQVSEAVGANQCLRTEILFIDDGSTDSTWGQIAAAAERDERVRGLRLTRNRGKTAALRLGFEQARGDVLVTLDADLQDDPAEIPRLLERLDQGYDVVVGWKRDRKDPWHKRWPSLLFNLIIRLTSGLRIHDNNCGLRCMRRSVLREITLFGHLHRFIVLLAFSKGFRVCEIEVKHHPRRSGTSKYGFGRFWGGLLDLLTVSFMIRFVESPLRAFGTWGEVCVMVGFSGLAYLAYMWLSGSEPIGNRPLLSYSVVTLLFGAQLFTLGILAEMLVWGGGASARNITFVEATSKAKLQRG